MRGATWAILLTLAAAAIASAQDSNNQSDLSHLSGVELQKALNKPRFGAGLPYDTVSRPRSPRAEAALQRLRKETGVDWKVNKWSKTTGGASMISPDRLAVQNGLTAGRGATPREKAENFVKDYIEIFLPPGTPDAHTPADFRFLFMRGRKVEFQQYSQGLPVHLGDLRVSFHDGSISGAGGRVFVLPEIETSPGISPEAAVRAIRESGAYGARKVNLPATGELVIYPSRPPRLAWSFKCPEGPTALLIQAHILVDAHSGEVLLGPRSTAADAASLKRSGPAGGGAASG